MTVRSDDIRRAAGTDMTSDPEDPHGWRFDCEVQWPPGPTTCRRVRAWWVCRRCGTTVRVSADVTRRPHGGNEAYDEMAALSELAVRANGERKRVHPRCSEARLVRGVLES